MEHQGRINHAATTAVVGTLLLRSLGVAAGVGLTILLVAALFGG